MDFSQDVRRPSFSNDGFKGLPLENPQEPRSDQIQFQLPISQDGDLFEHSPPGSPGRSFSDESYDDTIPHHDLTKATPSTSYTTPPAPTTLLKVVRVPNHLICPEKRVGDLVHAVNVERKPYSRRSAMIVPAKRFSDFLEGPGTALKVLHLHPHPALITMVDTIEADIENEKDGYIICEGLYKDISSWMSTCPTLEAKLIAAEQMTAIVAHCHSVGVVLQEIGRRSFCWSDASCTKVILSGLKSAKYVDIRSTEAKLLMAKDTRALGITLLKIFGSKNKKLSEKTLPAQLKSLLRSVLFAQHFNLPSLSEIAMQLQQCRKVSVEPVTRVKTQTLDDQVVPEIATPSRKRGRNNNESNESRTKRKH